MSKQPIPLSLIQRCSEAEFQALLKTHQTNNALLRWLLVARCSVDLPLFARSLFPETFRLPFAPFHHELFREHLRMGRTSLARRTGRRTCLAAPRGSAKSTVVSFLLVLHDLVYQRETYIILVSATQRQAQQRLRALRRELTENTPLVRLFAPRFGKENVQSSERHLVVGNVRIEAFGAGVEMRGISHNGWRPTKVILDDAESSASALSPRRRQKLLDWFTEVIDPIGQRQTHVLAIGTVLHAESLLSTLLHRPDFQGMRFASIAQYAPDSAHWRTWKALLTDPESGAAQGLTARETARQFFVDHREEMEKGSDVLWPESEDYEQLMAQLMVQGRRSFYQEKQNQPQGPEDALFRTAEAWRGVRTAAGWQITSPWNTPTRPAAKRDYPRESLRLTAHLDSALGKSKSTSQGDFAALAVLAEAPDGQLIAVDLWVRRASPREQLCALFDLHREYAFTSVTIEGTGFQELLEHPLEEERRLRLAQGEACAFPVHFVKPHQRKELRIAKLDPLLCNGKLALCETLPEEFWRELEEFPRTAHDDALDSLAAAVEHRRNSSGVDQGALEILSVGKRRTRNV